MYFKWYILLLTFNALKTINYTNMTKLHVKLYKCILPGKYILYDNQDLKCLQFSVSETNYPSI